MEDKFIHPLRGEVLLLDDPDYTVENGIVIPTPVRRSNLDYWVVRGCGDGFGTGDRVVLDDPNSGKKLKLDGVCYRLVKCSSVVAVVS